jgi:hypothetical protein
VIWSAVLARGQKITNVKPPSELSELSGGDRGSADNLAGCYRCVLVDPHPSVVGMRQVVPRRSERSAADRTVSRPEQEQRGQPAVRLTPGELEHYRRPARSEAPWQVWLEVRAANREVPPPDTGTQWCFQRPRGTPSASPVTTTRSAGGQPERRGH